MSFIAASIGLAGAGLGLVGNIVSSDKSASNQASAAGAASNSQQVSNAINYQHYLNSRGKNGSAVLPLYLKNGGGKFESQLGNDLVSAYNSSNVPLSTFQSAITPYKTAMDKAGAFTNDIFNGGITSKLLAEAQPVEQARSSSAMDALNRTLESIDAAQAGKGFSGDSYGNRMLEFSGREAQGNANVANLAENQQIRNYGDVTLPMNNLNLPGAMATTAGEMAYLPQNEYLSSIQSRMKPFDFLRLGQGNPGAVQPLPTPPPSAYGPSNLGMALSGVGGLLSSGASAVGGSISSGISQPLPSQGQMDQLNGGAGPVSNSYAGAQNAAGTAALSSIAQGSDFNFGF